MPRSLVDLLWRHHPDAPRRGRRGPESRVSVDDVVDAAIALADGEGLPAVTVRRLAAQLGVSAMSLYTHVNSRDDLVVLMADAAHARMRLPELARAGWRTRVRRVAESNLALLTDRPWLLDVTDDRTALGPGTIAKYDHELLAVEPLGLDDVATDAALSFVLDFARAAARSRRRSPAADELSQRWAEWAPRLGAYVGEAFPLARRVGSAAGEAQGTAYHPESAWRFGLDRVVDGLDALAARSSS